MCVLKLLKALKKICIFIMPAKKKQSRVAKLLSWKKKSCVELTSTYI